MKKYYTRPIDFTGCHPVIAEHLNRREAIECRVWDDDDLQFGSRRFVCQYMGGEEYPYIADSGAHWMYAEPIPLKVKRIMPPERAIPVLIAEGWRFDENGVLLGDQPIIPPMFKEMGGPIDNSLAVWPSCIIEEVEDDE